MVIKLIKEIDNTKIDSIVEADDITAKDYITKGLAIEYTKDIESKEQEEIVSGIEVKEIKVKKEIKNMDMTKKEAQHAIGEVSAMLMKGMKMEEIIVKVASGNNEGTAADGGNLVYTAVSELMGNAMEGNKIYDKVFKKKLPVGASAMKISVDASDPFLRGNAPVVATTGEGIAKTDAKLAFDAVTLTPKKQTVYVPVTDELLQDVPSLEGEVKYYLNGKMGLVCDDLIMNGDPSLTGVYGVLDSNAAGYVVSVSVSATPTIAQLVKMENSVAARYQDQAEWFMPNSVWSIIAGGLGTSANINLSQIDIAAKTLLGRKVNLIHSMAASTLVIGAPQSYVVVEPSINDILRVSYDVMFKTDETVFRLVKRIAGCPTYRERTATDGTAIAGFASATFASA